MDLIPMITDYALKAGGVLVLFGLTFFIAKRLKLALQAAINKTDKIEDTLGRFVATAAYWIFLILAVLSILSYFGVQTTSFAAVIGGASLAIGLAFQGTLSNLASGVMLLLFRPFKVGDVIRVSGEIGSVEELGLFTTQLRTLDNRLIIIPNSKVFGSTIENMTAAPIRRVDVKITTSNAADLNQTRAILEAAAGKTTGVLDDPERPVQVYLLKQEGGTVTWEARVWCDTGNYWDVREALNTELKLALDAEGMMLVRPFEKGDVVKLAGELGIVEEKGLFGVKLKTLDNRELTIPNGAFAGSTIENLTGAAQRRVDVNVGTAYEADLKKTREVLETAAAEIPNILNTGAFANQIFLAELGDSCINWQIRVWCDTAHYWDVWQATTQLIKLRLDEAGVSIPYPQLDVHHGPL